jgi:hypothetical protein
MMYNGFDKIYANFHIIVGMTLYLIIMLLHISSYNNLWCEKIYITFNFFCKVLLK